MKGNAIWEDGGWVMDMTKHIKPDLIDLNYSIYLSLEPARIDFSCFIFQIFS